jgi:hypothetical protein
VGDPAPDTTVELDGIEVRITGFTRDVPVGDLTPHPQNPNQGDVGAVIESIQTNGFLDPVLVQESNRRIIDGEHRWRAVQQMHGTTVPVLWTDVDDETALRFMLAANETARRGSNDDHVLAALLTDMAQQTERGLTGTGYTNEGLDQLLADLQTEHRDPRDYEGDPAVKREGYDATDIRQLILVVDKQEYLWVLGMLREVQRREGIESNTDAVVHLLRVWGQAAGYEFEAEAHEPADDPAA